MLRSLQWRFALPGFSGALDNRFNCRSSYWPPPGLIPRRILRLCRKLRSISNNLVRGCRSCYDGEDNLTPEQRAELKRLHDSSDLSVQPADKGGKWVVVSTEEYDAEAFRQLGSSAYQHITCDRSIFVTQRLSSLLRGLKTRRFITRRELATLLPPREAQQRTFYLLPKVHKPIWPTSAMPPGRPIVSDVGSVSRQCASFIDFFLRPIVQRSSSYVRDSLHVIALLQDLWVDCDTILFTLDVASLYTSIPIDEGILAVSDAFLQHPDDQRPDLTILSMLSTLLRNHEFVFKSTRWRQCEGVAMGSAFGGSFANIFMSQWEELALRSATLSPSIWLRYQDDIFGLWNHGLDSLSDFVSHLNLAHPKIQLELQHNSSDIRFLDINIRRENNSLLFSVGFKDTDSHKILPASSYHPAHVFRGVLFSEFLRWSSHSSTFDDFKSTFAVVTPVWKRHGYTRSAIRQALSRALRFTGQQQSWGTGFLPCSDLTCLCWRHGHFTTFVRRNTETPPFLILSRLSCSTLGAVYLLFCDHCGTQYVGESGRCLLMRIREHLYAIRSGRPSTSVAAHFQRPDCPLHYLRFCAIDRSPDTTRRREKEARWIRRLSTLEPNGLNKASECLPQPPVPLVLPFSACAEKTASAVKRACSLARVRPSFRRGRNLRAMLQ